MDVTVPLVAATAALGTVGCSPLLVSPTDEEATVDAVFDASPPPIPPGIALATRLASNSTKTTLGFNSRTIFPANSAEALEM